MDDCNVHLPQYCTRSQCVHRHTFYKWVKMQVDKDLLKYNGDGTLTSDMHNDNRLKAVYALVDELFWCTSVDMNIMNHVKVLVLFHKLSIKLCRVHNK